MALLAVDTVGKSYRGRKVLSAASLSVDAGAITFLAGRNGTGKTTLLRICAGWAAPDYGTIRIDGQTYPRAWLHRLARRGVFYLPAGSMLSPTFTVRQHLIAVAKRCGTDGIEQVAEVLGISEFLDAVPLELSGGERRRAGVALALVRRPRCLLMDEPLRGVAPRDTETIIAALRQLADSDCGILVTGHDLPVLLAAADRVVWLTAGTTYPLGSPAEARSDPRFRKEFLGSPPNAARPVSAPQPKPGHAQPERSPLGVDAQTFRDLEIFETQPGGRSLFDTLDRSRTRGGRAWLHRHFMKPPSDLDEIAGIQHAVQFIMEHSEVFARLPDEERLMEVDRYRRSNYTLSYPSNVITATAQGTWYRLRHGEIWGALERGVTATLGFLHSMRALAESVQDLDPPGALARIVEPIAASVRGEEMRSLRLDVSTHPVAASKVLAYDRLLREQLRPEIDRILKAVHEIDALQSMALATREHGFVFPALRRAERPVLRVEGAYHPFLRDPVPNDFGLAAGKRLLFLTGPNMAGKTTYLKACALCAYLAHLGMGVPARAMEVSPFEALLSGINTTDDIRLGHSYFHSEVRRVKDAALLLREGKRALIVFDEMFKGTNVRDAYEASRAVIAGFAGFPSGICIVSSHLVELVPDLDPGPVYFQYFDAEIRDGGPIYDHRLKNGSSAQRLGMTLLEREGVLELLGSEPRAFG